MKKDTRSWKKLLEKIVEHSCEGHLDCPLQLVKQTKIKNSDHLQQIHSKLVKQGAEGSMIRMPGSYYEQKRSGTLLKIKDFHDEDCIIDGYEMGTGKYKGMLGALRVHLVNDPSIEFNIGSGFNDEQRKNYKKYFKIGSNIKVTFNGYTDLGIPRFPRYVGENVDR